MAMTPEKTKQLVVSIAVLALVIGALVEASFLILYFLPGKP